MLPFKKCDGCGRDLPLGSTKYNVKVEIASEFDGYLPDGELDEEFFKSGSVLDRIEAMTAEELEEDVHVEMSMTLCKRCKESLLEQMENYADGQVSTKHKLTPSIH